MSAVPGGAVAGLQAVSQRYGDDVALDAVTLDIPGGCLAGIIGPDGVGKSSLLALIAGARKLQAGEVTVLGGNMRSRQFRNQVAPRIAYMPQGLGRNLYFSLSVRENIAFFADLFGLTPRQKRDKTRELLAATGLSAFSDRPAGKLSGGMKQKLGLCCALIHDPDLLILDEPTTGVDPLSRRQFWELIARIQARRPGMSVVVATAYMDEAARFDWLAAMDEGRILASGSPQALLTQTSSPNLDAAFIQLLPETKRHDYRTLDIPPLVVADGVMAIEARDLTCRFGDFVAVDRVNFSIARGEIFGFLGSNGCGKTTTMKMLTGLLQPTSGTSSLFGKALANNDRELRRRVGYMSQGFSLYGELTVQQNLELHARLFAIAETAVAARVGAMLTRFGLDPYAADNADSLPLGIRQRLSLAVAIIHEPDILILDEPTSGVDPVARDNFWAELITLSRQQGVTIFISTHFMNEAERCDRISLMHAGRVLATDTPAALVATRGATHLEEAFVAYLQEAIDEVADEAIDAPAAEPVMAVPTGASPFEASPLLASPVQESPAAEHPIPASPVRAPRAFDIRRLLAYARREQMELIRDPVRLTIALLGSVVLMLILGYGITMDVDDLTFAVFDRDNTPQSRDYVANIAGSAYFIQHAPIASTAELDQRLRTGELALALEIPSGFGRDVKKGAATDISFWIDGAMPFRGETVLGYVQGIHLQYLQDAARRLYGAELQLAPANLQVRYRYNPQVLSIYAMAPAVIPLMLVFIPAILMALAIVREKELGSITNLYVTPVTRWEFLLGKQLPYVGIGLVSFLGLVALTIVVFGVPFKGDFWALLLATVVYLFTTTGLGLFISAFTRTQIAALAVTALTTILVAVSFSGLTEPVSSLSGPGRIIGQLFPMTYYLNICRGIFTKGLVFADIARDFIILCTFVPILTVLSYLVLDQQEK